MSWKHHTAVLWLALSLAACGPVRDDHAAHDHDDHDHADPSEVTPGSAAGHAADEPPADGEVRVPLAGLRGLAFQRVGEPQEEGVWAPAEAVSDAAAVAVVTAPAAGIVRALLVRPGEAVQRGQAVAELVSAELADLAARYRSAQGTEAQARREVERERLLFGQNATSRRELEAAEAHLAAAMSETLGARQSLSARGVAPEGFSGTLRLSAPAAGTLERWEISLGQGVAAGTSLATIRDRAATRVRVELSPPGPTVWDAGAVTEVRRGDGTRWQATVEGLPAGLTADTRRYPYLLKLATGPFPSPGTPLEVRVPLARGIVLPQEALQIIEGDWGVFVKEGTDAVFRKVRRGAELGGDVLVLEGLEPGVEVATAGAYLLRPLWMKRMGGGEQHAH
ncbi:MAG: efflux RND transporter periplasmic adaptor subunit [Thermoanaerobaculia bacterium]|nr:efflux RND transporter periplasmic adaptor subunit [Thermoanaerobaculia bacterium]